MCKLKGGCKLKGWMGHYQGWMHKVGIMSGNERVKKGGHEIKRWMEKGGIIRCAMM